MIVIASVLLQNSYNLYPYFKFKVNIQNFEPALVGEIMGLNYDW